MKNIFWLVAVAFLVSISVGSAMALVLHEDDTKVTGNFEVQNPAGSSITVQNSGAFQAIKLNDIDDGQIYQFRLIGTGARMDLTDITHDRVNIAILSSNGNVGIGTTTPTEALDVNGNVRADNYFDNGNTQTGTDASALGGTGNIASNTGSTVGGGDSNTASGMYSTVGGGMGNEAEQDFTFVGGGESNEARVGHTVVGGGLNNLAEKGFSFIGGGQNNLAEKTSSVVAGGFANKARGIQSSVVGGDGNVAFGLQASIGGGHLNLANGIASTVPGGSQNEAIGAYSFAAGRNATAQHNGTIVFADSTGSDFTSTAENQFSIRADGGVRIFSDSGLGSGVLLAGGSNSWAGVSDDRLKNNISEYSVLDKLDDYRTVEFDWKIGGNHDVGVMAQELQSIFPELVNVGSNGEISNAADPGVWSVQYSKLGALALQAIKEQQTQIDEQQNLIDSLIAVICADDKELGLCQGN